jgi:hypothetical protein
MRLPNFGGVNGILGGCQYQLSKLNEARPFAFLEFEHQPDDLKDVVRVPLLELFQSRVYKLLAIIDLVLLVEPSDILHGAELKEYKAGREYIRFENVMSDVPRISTIFHMCLPEDR